MRTVVTITTGPLDWSPQKLTMMKRDILLFLQQQSAPSAKWVETQVGADGKPLSEPKDSKDAKAGKGPGLSLVKLKCKSCDKAPWYADKFTACPLCNQRTTVVKASIRREIPPAGALILPA